MSPRRITLTLGAAAGGLLAAAFLPMAVASADEVWYVPDPLSFDAITAVTGLPPYSPEVVTGTENWVQFDFTTNTLVTPPSPFTTISGVDTETVFGSFTNNDFSNGRAFDDLANFGGGWENLWVDLLPGGGSGPGLGVSDLLITPFGDFPLLGTLF
jgi:hypothetical protein